MVDENSVAGDEESQVDEGVAQTPETEGNDQNPSPEGNPPADEDIDNPDIPVRSNASQIISRLKRQRDRLRSQPNREVDNDQVDDDSDDNLGQEDHKPDISERLERVEETVLGQAEEQDLLNLFDKEPEAKKYEKRIKAYMQHDAYSAASPEVIYHHLSYNEAREATSKKKEAADLEAGQMRSAGSSVRQSSSRDEKSAEEIANMSDEEFMEYDRELQAKAANNTY